MGLKQDIVIVNEFSTNGSRGATPGQYVMRYMARDKATQVLAPIRRTPIEDFTWRYMARESAVNTHTTVRGVKTEMAQAQGKGGRAFGYGQVSLSHDELMAGCKDLQRLHDEGKTVMKTVLSFDQDYIKRMGLVPPDFVCVNPGDYRGQLDEMKLRMAVMRGMQRMAHGYDDLRWVAVIQVDTEHVHCHLAMADAGRGRVMPDGTQRGKIDDKSKSLIRRGIDSFLDEKQVVKHLSSAVGYDKRNVTTYVKRWAHEQMVNETLPQFLISCLPEDRSLWRAGSKANSMRKANAVVHELVMDVLERPDSPLPMAMLAINKYADTRAENENLTSRERQRLVDQGKREIVNGCINGVFTMLKSLPEDALTVRTPTLDMMSMDMIELSRRAKDPEAVRVDPMIDYGYRLRTYSSRLRHHTAERERYGEMIEQWDQADEVGVASDQSRVLRDFYASEQDYHERCMSKYQWFLPVSPAMGTWHEQWDEVATYGERIISLELMRKDASLGKLSDPDEAEERGFKIYGQRGGRALTQGKTGRDELDRRIEIMRDNYAEKLVRLQAALAAQGLVIGDCPLPEVDEEDEDEKGLIRRPTLPDPVVETGSIHDFELVKGLDMHHMRYDFTMDVPVGLRTRDRFVEMAERRRDTLDAALRYLEATDQMAAVDTLPVDDIEQMLVQAQRLNGDEPVLHSSIAELFRAREDEVRRSATVRMGTMAEAVKHQVATEVDRVVREVLVVDKDVSAAERIVTMPALGAGPEHPSSPAG